DEDADRRGLAGAVRPQEAERLACVDLERDVVDGPGPVGVDLREVRDVDERAHRWLSGSTPVNTVRTSSRANRSCPTLCAASPRNSPRNEWAKHEPRK